MKIAFAAQSPMRAYVFLAPFLLVATSLLNSQETPGAQSGESQATVQEQARTAKATRVDRSPRLDGTLDDSQWQMASPITNLLQREPFEGQPPTEKTEVRILYDRHDVYFGVLCF
jgi:hypothetical protein